MPSLCSLFLGCFPIVSGSILISAILSLMLFLSNQQLRQTDIERAENQNESRPITYYILEYREILIDVMLVLAFIIQHSFMASKVFKTGLNKCGLQAVERCVYVAFTGLTLMMMIYYWQPIYSISAWLIDTSESWFLWLFFSLVHVFAWIIILFEVLIMEPMELIGWKQVYYYWNGYENPVTYKSRGLKRLYEHMRHPGAGCFLLILWLHPLMSVDRLIIAWFLTMYLKCGFNVKRSDYNYYEKHRLVKVSFEENVVDTSM